MGVTFPYTGSDKDALDALKPTRFLQSDSKIIIDLAQKAIGNTDDAAKAAGSAAPCLLTDEAALRWQCVARQAERAGKVETCKLLPEVAVEKGELSRDLCKAHLAIAWGKSALCAELVTPNLGDACILQLVQRGGEKTLCGKIVNAHLKTACADVSKP